MDTVNKKIWIGLAVFLYAVTGAVLVYIEVVFSKGAIKTKYLYYIIMPPVILLVNWLESGTKPEGTEKTEKPKKEIWIKLKKLSGVAITVLLAAVLTYFLVRNRYLIAVYHALGLLVFVAIMEVYTKLLKRKITMPVRIVPLGFAVILLSTAVYMMVLKPCSVAKAELRLHEDGYKSVEFVGSFAKESIGMTLENGAGIYDNAVYIDSYLFLAYEEDGPYGVYVDAATGEILVRGELEKNPVLKILVSMNT